MKIRMPKVPMKWVWLFATLAVVIVGGLTWKHWFPATNAWVNQTAASFRSGGGETHDSETAAEPDPHAGHDHAAHAGHDEATSLELSKQAIRNIGLSDETIRPIKLETFRRSITVPAVVVERPGRSRVQVATPMTGVVTHVHAVQGEAVEPGSLLFQIRLTHEDLVNAQTDFLRTLGELDVEQREVARLQQVTSSGAIAGKVLLERQYARDKLNANLSAMRESLRLHGLSDNQVEQIQRERRLLRELQVFAPNVDSHGEDELRLTQRVIQAGYVKDEQPKHTGPLILQDLAVHKGQSINAGETLCILTDYDELFIEGLAFEQDIKQLRKASQNGWAVDAILEEPGSESRVIEGLKMAYLANQVDAKTRTLNFYVRLPNEVAKDHRADGNRYVEWRYVPGQRMQLRVPVQEMPEQIVVPVEAVASEGAETFVFQQNGSHFDRVPVHVKYRDQYSAVIDNDGSLFPGDVIAMRGAHQMQMALKNKSGGGVDPHAGHNH
ncbi:Multidrug resistance protein MdtA [Rubripirellula tenax]|uniref:Multidrug resistance protein MdtA n=1 Tax=Rubripirellula tenax TaxID=2528015 RepID=A0A5C6F0B6_9BACT|nr:efflux RND transporter periplasmic adaptor subunit [Rubripirellula tenax]TWU54828.1 Multidrug resistance protein MdtA [Rubripirellula tenax]